MENSMEFRWYDYTLFGLTLASSAILGIYFVYCGKRKQTTEEYLLGSKQMKLFPVSMSLVASSLSAIALIAVPAEVYVYGFYYELTAASLIFMFVPCYTYLPVFYKIGITSGYEYLEMRFNKTIRLITAVLYLLYNSFLLPLYVYLPIMILHQGKF